MAYKQERNGKKRAAGTEFQDKKHGGQQEIREKSQESQASVKSVEELQEEGGFGSILAKKWLSYP
jgi:hypothetical protein